MPIHDWTTTSSGYFHHFHQQWTIRICDFFSSGALPKGCFALVEPHSESLVETGPIAESDMEAIYAAKANRIAIYRDDETVAVIEIVSPGNKSSVFALRQFVEKSQEFLDRGINLLAVDLFPPTARDPQGIHPAIWAKFNAESFSLPEDQPLTLASYVAGETKKAYMEVAAVGDVLPEMPVFLDSRNYIRVPLEEAYESTWKACPEEFRERVSNIR